MTETITLEISVHAARVLHHLLSQAHPEFQEYESEIRFLKIANLEALYFQANIDMHEEMKAIGLT